MYKFYAFLSRQKYINRWSLMRNTRQENVSEHSHQTALIAHALGVIEKVIYKKDVNPDRCATLALYHETAEVLTGDLPTPIKYLNTEIRDAYKKVERSAEDKLLQLLPDELIKEMSLCVQPFDSIEKQLVGYADKIAALIKCIEELGSKNDEFISAYEVTSEKLKQYNSDSVNYFLKNFVEAFFLNLDDLSRELD